MAVSWGMASRQKKFARVLCEGPTGAGKTKSSLLLASGLLKPEKKIFLIDTERESASLYANEIPFVTTQLSGDYSPEKYIECIKSVPEDQCGCLIIDSISHEWTGVGGCLQIHAALPGNSYVNWGKVGARHQAFIEAILNAPFDVICCCRSKMAYAQEEEGGKKVVKKLGMEPQQRDGFDYEVDLVLTLQQGNHLAVATKNRTSLWTDGTPFLITPAEGYKLRQWLDAEEADPNTVFAYDLIAMASRIKDVDELGQFYANNRDKINICSQKALINTKFAEMKRDLGVTEERATLSKGLTV